MLNRTFLTLILFGISCFSEADEPPVKLEVMPDFCVKSSDDEQCHFNLNIQVTLNSAQDVCIVMSNDLYKKCYTQKSELNESISIALSSDVRISVLDANNRVLAEHAIRMANFKVKKVRPRRNLGWILF
jgi:hypothetical protein